MPEPTRTVSYFAVSILTSRTAIFAALTTIAGILSLPDVVGLIPPRYLPITLAAVGAINVVLRQITVRPVAWIKPGDTVPVPVERIGPPPPAVVTD